MSVLHDVFRMAPPDIRQQLMKLVKNDESVQITAIRALVESECRPAADVMRERIWIVSPNVAEEMLRGMNHLNPELARMTAVELACSDNSDLVKLGNTCLDHLDPERAGRMSTQFDEIVESLSVDVLVERLFKGEVSEKIMVAQRLGEVADEKAVPILMRLLHHPSTELVRSLLESIRQLSPDNAPSAGQEVFWDRRETHQKVAVEFLARCGEAGIEILWKNALDQIDSDDPHPNKLVRLMIEESIRYGLDDLLKQCRKNVGWGWGLNERRIRAVIALGVIGNPGLQVEGIPVEERWDRCASLMEDGLTDDEWQIPSSILKVLIENRWPCLESALDKARQYLAGEDSGLWGIAIEFLGHYGEDVDKELVLEKLGNPDWDSRHEALKALVLLAPERRNWISGVLNSMQDDFWRVRWQATEILGTHGESKDVDRVVEMFKDEDDSVRKAALDAATKLSPEKAGGFALEMITDPSGQVTRKAISILRDAGVADKLMDTLLGKIKKARGESGRELLELIKKEAPERLEEAISMAMIARKRETRSAVIDMLSGFKKEKAEPLLRQLMEDRSGDVRLSAFQVLKPILPPEERKKVAIELLRDGNSAVRCEALTVLEDDDDPTLVDDLLPLARDQDDTVRWMTIGMIAKMDDPRVFPELVSSLNDVDVQIRDLAEEILNGKHGPVPVLNRFGRSAGDKPIWETVLKKVDGINTWASQVGRELLGRPVVVHQYRQSIGRTHARHRSRVVEIEVADTPVTTGHPSGEEIMKGIALHEIGHHLYDIGVKGHRSTRGIARSEGLEEIYNILVDERLERKLRSRRPEYGVYFDRLASYVFTQDTYSIPLSQYARLTGLSDDELEEAVTRGELPGQLQVSQESGDEDKVMLREFDLFTIPGVVPMLTAFTLSLRGGFDPRVYPDSALAEAIGRIPANLRDLSHGEVLELARKLGDIIGRSNRHKREYKQFLQMLREFRAALRRLAGLLERMGSSGQLPEWMRREGAGIRKNRPVPISERSSLDEGVFELGKTINLGPELDFQQIKKEQKLPYNESLHKALVEQIRVHIRRLRAYFEKLGTRTIPDYASRRGRRIDVAVARKAALTRSPDLLVYESDILFPDLYFGVLIDRSASMEGQKIELAKSFGVLAAESARGLNGIEGHVNAFDDETFFTLGDFKRNAIASLEVGGGNNDAGALAIAANLALRSKKGNKLIVMISDGSPTECTVESLRHLVEKLTKDFGIVCVQVAVDKIEEIAFPHFVDLSRYSMDEAVARFGKLIVRLTESWR